VGSCSLSSSAMHTAPAAYVRFAYGAEEIQPNEEQLLDETAASMARVNHLMFERRHAIRDAHAKSHGIIPAQGAFSPARRVFSSDVLSFNPFCYLLEHQPLGSINWARLQAYGSSTNYRHATNAQPKIEPIDIRQLPD
jgi:hypothetical protein